MWGCNGCPLPAHLMLVDEESWWRLLSNHQLSLIQSLAPSSRPLPVPLSKYIQGAFSPHLYTHSADIHVHVCTSFTNHPRHSIRMCVHTDIHTIRTHTQASQYVSRWVFKCSNVDINWLAILCMCAYFNHPLTTCQFPYLGSGRVSS